MSKSTVSERPRQAVPFAERAEVSNRIPYRFAPDPKKLWEAIEADAYLPRPSKEPPPDWEPDSEDRADSWRRRRRRIMDDRLRSLDTHVLKTILGFKPRVSYLRWCPQRVIMERLGKKERTIRLSYRRLARNGFIRLRPVPVPDPDDPRNKTGYQIVLLFDENLPPALRDEPDLDRRPPLERKVWTRVSGENREPVASPHTPLFEPVGAPLTAQPVASEMAQPVASKQWRARGSKDVSELDSQTSSSLGCMAEAPGPDDDEVSTPLPEKTPPDAEPCANAVPPAELVADVGQAEDSTPGRELMKLPPAVDEPPPADPGLFGLAVELAREFIDSGTAGKIQRSRGRLARKCGADLDPASWMILLAVISRCALMRPRRRKPIGWIWKTLLDYTSNGVDAEAEDDFAELLKQREENARVRARQEAAEKQRSGPLPGQDEPLSREELDDLREFLKLPPRDRKRLNAERILRELGLLPDEEPEPGSDHVPRT